MSMESDRFDVIIVGGGGAGLTASLEAARQGLKVMLLEKNDRLGGTTAISIGSVTAGSTSFQKRAGIKDDPDQYFEDLDCFERPEGATDNLELRRLLTENAADTVEWLLSLGLSFAGPMPEPPHRHPRMHNILPNVQAFIYRLSRECRKHGVNIRTRSRVETLLTEGKGVTGVKVRDQEGVSFSLFSNRGVILTTGDYSAGTDLREKYLPSEMAGLEAINPTSTGDGHRLALAVGATILNAHLTTGPKIRFPPPRQTF